MPGNSNFRLVGVGTSVRLGKAGPVLVANSGQIDIRGADGITLSAVRGATATDSNHLVTLTQLQALGASLNSTLLASNGSANALTVTPTGGAAGKLPDVLANCTAKTDFLAAMNATVVDLGNKLDANGSANALTVTPTGSATQNLVDALALALGRGGFRNRVRNGRFAINQRVVSGTVTLAAGVYGHDGWKAGSSGCTYTFSAAANGDTTLSISAGSLQQVVEGGTYVQEGGTYVLSWSGTATGRLYQGGSPGGYSAGPIVLNGLTAGTNATVEFSTGTVGLVQMEPGQAASSFERRDDELRRNRRYFQRWTQPPARGVILSTTSVGRMGWPLDTPMMTTPLLALNGSLTVTNGPNSTTISSLGTGYSTIATVEFDAQVSTQASFASGQAAILIQSGTGSLDLSAEL